MPKLLKILQFLTVLKTRGVVCYPVIATKATYWAKSLGREVKRKEKPKSNLLIDKWLPVNVLLLPVNSGNAKHCNNYNTSKWKIELFFSAVKESVRVYIFVLSQRVSRDLTMISCDYFHVTVFYSTWCMLCEMTVGHPDTQLAFHLTSLMREETWTIISYKIEFDRNDVWETPQLFTKQYAKKL